MGTNGPIVVRSWQSAIAYAMAHCSPGPGKVVPLLTSALNKNVIISGVIKCQPHLALNPSTDPSVYWSFSCVGDNLSTNPTKIVKPTIRGLKTTITKPKTAYSSVPWTVISYIHCNAASIRHQMCIDPNLKIVLYKCTLNNCNLTRQCPHVSGNPKLYFYPVLNLLN